LTPANWSILTAVNEQTNDAITPEDDMEHYGRAEYWDIPTDGRGNCKDYALTKRKLLIEAGLPALALRIAIVLTPSGERHAVLTIATDQGDYVLDNLTGEIRPWSQAGYSWIERQASNSPWNWVAFQNGTTQWETASLAATPTGPVSSTRDFLPAVLQ
jgi:predicted transglutaminase-like cysteine proteinase